MYHYIVLLKQVPDVSQITDNAFDPVTGNLIRTRLASVINELDAQALAFAQLMRTLSGDTAGKLICLSMGPPMAAEVLRYGLSRHADDAILLTDRALGGADTWATANPLAYAIRKIAAEMLGGAKNYYVVAGCSGGRRHGAVRRRLPRNWGFRSCRYVTDAEYKDGRFQFTRIISGGSQVVQPRSTPAVITVAKYEYPLYASFAASRWARRFELKQWCAADVKATAMGVAGSKTRVIRVFPPGKTTRKCHAVQSVKELADCIVQNLGKAGGNGEDKGKKQASYVLPPKRGSLFDRDYEGTEKEREDFRALARVLKEMHITDPAQITEEVQEKILATEGITFHKKALEDMLEGYKHTTASYSGDVWVMAEHDQGVIHPATFELTGKARELADSLDVGVGVVLVGGRVKAMAADLIAAGADTVYVVESPLLERFDPAAYRKAVTAVYEKYRPQIFLYGATPQGRVLAPMISYHVGCGLTADCTGLDIRDSSRKGQIAVLMQTRPALGGNVMATICTKDSACQMATARPGVMKRLAADPNRKGQIVEVPVDITPEDVSLDILQTEHAQGRVNFDSDVIVSGGKGMLNRDGYERLLDTLCEALRGRFGVNVEKGASRTAVEQGFAERIRQVGQTGTAVGPKLYVAIGISGAIQHMIGVANTETIVAINSDPHAPIFRQCDYYIVGNAEKIVPELVAALKG